MKYIIDCHPDRKFDVIFVCFCEIKSKAHSYNEFSKKQREFFLFLMSAAAILIEMASLF
jgi:hypothetical protein